MGCGVGNLPIRWIRDPCAPPWGVALIPHPHLLESGASPAHSRRMVGVGARAHVARASPDFGTADHSHHQPPRPLLFGSGDKGVKDRYEGVPTSPQHLPNQEQR